MKMIINGVPVNIPGGAPSGGESLPIDSVIMWVGTLDTIPPGWHLCDGTDGTFDLRGMFVLGAGGAYNLGDDGGSEEVTLTVEQMPQHRHTYYSAPISKTVKVSSSTSSTAPTITDRYSADQESQPAGSSQPHPNMPPYKALYYIQKIA